MASQSLNSTDVGDESFFTELVEALCFAAKVAGRGLVVGAGLHLGQQLIRGVASGKLLKKWVKVCECEKHSRKIIDNMCHYNYIYSSWHNINFEWFASRGQYLW